jgi:hypothetical protein
VRVALGTWRGWTGSSVHVDANLGKRTDDLPVRLHQTALFGIKGHIIQPRERADRVGMVGALFGKAGHRFVGSNSERRSRRQRQHECPHKQHR